MTSWKILRRTAREVRADLPGLLLALTLAAPGDVRAADISGEVQGSLPAGLYHVTGDIVVPAGGTLVLAPGVTFEFEHSVWSEYELDARGTLLAEGTEADPITFRPAAGVPEFNFLRIASSASRLRHCVIERTGRVSGLDEGGLWIDGCSPLVEDCRIADARWSGVVVTGAGAWPTLARTRVSGSAGAGICASGGAGLRLENCASTENETDGVSLAEGPNLLTGCLVADNGANGVDGEGLAGLGSVLVNCTVAGNCGADLEDAVGFELYNCLVMSRPSSWGIADHTYAVADQTFFGFVDPGAGDYRLTATSPGRDAGTRFGIPAAVLPATDLDGNPRRHGIVDLGAYESTIPSDTGESGPFFSPALLQPRLTRPAFAVPGTAISVQVAALGSYLSHDVAVDLLPEGGSPWPLSLGSVTPRDVEPGSALAVQLYPMGIERVQEIAAAIPAGTPEGLHGIRVRLGDHVFESPQAVRIHSQWPSRWGLLHVTDTHVGADGESHTAAERLRVLVREANFLQPELVVVTGDLCENGNLETGAWTDSLLTILRGLKVPVLAMAGNHERYNENGAYNPLGYFRHFQEVNRCLNGEVSIGGARIYTLDTGPEMGATELFRCLGPTDAALDWMESRLSGLDPLQDRPRFLLTHGPNFDYFTWNGQNNSRVRDLETSYGFALSLAGHSHRFEAYRNEGTNWLGRNDYLADDDWGRDVPFPGFPLHLQTSSLGKDEHLPFPAQAVPAGFPEPPDAPQRGVLGDDIGFRWIEVEGKDVSFFSADTDGDGWRSTEYGWLLGELDFAVHTAPDGTITSMVTNHHHETWKLPHHFIPIAADVPRLITGGTFVHRYADGTVEVEVESIGPNETSVVTLFPNHPAAVAEREEPAGLEALGNPFTESVRFVVRLGEAPRNEATPAAEVAIFDPAGRRVRLLHGPAVHSTPVGPAIGDPDHASNGNDAERGDPGDEWKDGPSWRRGANTWEVSWDGRDQSGREVPPGVYFARVEGGRGRQRTRVVKLR